MLKYINKLFRWLNNSRIENCTHITKLEDQIIITLSDFKKATMSESGIAALKYHISDEIKKSLKIKREINGRKKNKI